jgi:hypothetical protein
VRSVRPNSHGFTIVEVTLALAVSATVVGLVVQTVVGLGHVRLRDQQRTRAIEEAANLMEALQARPWNEHSDEQLTDLQLSEGFQRVAPRATLTVTIALVEQPVSAKRITITIAGTDTANHGVTLATLSAWKYSMEGNDE